MEHSGESIAQRPLPRDLVGSLTRGLAVMEVLAANPSGMTLTEVAIEMGLTRAGARRFLLTLVAAGYAIQEGRKFLLSPRLISIARTWISAASLWTFAEPFMRAVSQHLNESCSAAILSDEDVVYVARVAGRRILSVALQVGTRLPAYCTSMGRVLLSDLSSKELDSFLERATISANTPKTKTNISHLAKEIAKAHSAGYAVVDEELEIGLRSIAVPIRDRDGHVVAALNVSTQSARHTVREMEVRFLPPLREAVTGIENYFAIQ